LAEYGGHVGIAFQVVDDVLGIWGDPSITGKPVGSDLLGHKMTLPVVAAIAASNGSGSRLEALLDEIAGRTPPDESLLDEARRLLEAAGALEAAKDVADAHLEAAVGALGDVKLEKGPLEELVELAQFVVRRTW
jgi:geranylgeranyl diphosphate synthase type I